MMQKYAIVGVVIVVIAVVAGAVVLMSGPAPSPTPTTSPTTVPTTATTTPARKLKIAMIEPSTPIDDLGWGQSFYEPIKKVADDLGYELSVSELFPFPELEPTIRDYAEKGYDLIIGVGVECQEAISAVAPSYPNSYFVCYYGYEAKSANSYAMEPNTQEVCFLAGIIAGSMTKSNKVGNVGGIPFPTVSKEQEAFKLGALWINPNVKVYGAWTGSFVDLTAAREAATSQFQEGVDWIISGDHMALVVISTAMEYGDRYFVAEYYNPVSVAPDVVVTATSHNIEGATRMLIDRILKGTWKQEAVSLGLKDSMVSLAPYGKFDKIIPQEVKDKVEMAKQAIIKGTLQVPYIDKALTEEEFITYVQELPTPEEIFGS